MGRILVVAFFSGVLGACSLHTEVQLTQAEQLKKDLEVIDGYLSDKGITAMEDLSGLRFTVQSVGTGLPVRIDDQVQINFSEKFLPTEAALDQGSNTLKLTDAMPGLMIGLPLLPAGSRATLYIPSIYYYPGQIPAKNLIYEVEVVKIVKTATQLEQLGKDTVAIDNFLASKSITAVKDPTGVRYVIHDQGTGKMPGWYDKVKVTYTGSVLNLDIQFFSGTKAPTSDFLSRVVDYVSGLQVGIQKLNAGGKMTLYVPSTLGFGASPPGNGSIPANANLVFELELLEVIE